MAQSDMFDDDIPAKGKPRPKVSDAMQLRLKSDYLSGQLGEYVGALADVCAYVENQIIASYDRRVKSFLRNSPTVVTESVTIDLVVKTNVN